ncbi:hypothetical protein HL658_02215 [Azospirillum sp. RWY-5-1]|uniref:Uncharacterized protein n=1 Tax=Azospirillum oleiclasticum TaxID=2735135 RepID=A0ABX2T5T6_9PROT|nr:hypothetical protein [Azospirillum oleiclasticum]NYZ11352.1 hypothetical protein [Azospirillum oleiclasticum]NYZ18513.1 hypothetical protein [Azospirillum oleiclasticum]
MGVGSIGGTGFSPYTSALGSGPTSAPQTDEAESTRQAEEETRRRQEATTTQPTSGGNTTATRGQNLNIVV